MLFSWQEGKLNMINDLHVESQVTHQTPYSKNCCTRSKPWQNNSKIFGAKKEWLQQNTSTVFSSKHPGAKEKLFRWGKLLCLHLPFSDLFWHHGDGIRLAGARSTWILIGILVEEIWGDGEMSMTSPCFVCPGAAFFFANHCGLPNSTYTIVEVSCCLKFAALRSVGWWGITHLQSGLMGINYLVMYKPFADVRDHTTAMDL